MDLDRIVLAGFQAHAATRAECVIDTVFFIRLIGDSVNRTNLGAERAADTVVGYRVMD
jgi:hypothetical protein